MPAATKMRVMGRALYSESDDDTANQERDAEPGMQSSDARGEDGWEIPQPRRQRSRRKSGTEENAEPTPRHRKPQDECCHILLRNVPNRTKEVIARLAVRKDQSLNAYLVDLLNRFAERHSVPQWEG